IEGEDVEPYGGSDCYLKWLRVAVERTQRRSSCRPGYSSARTVSLVTLEPGCLPKPALSLLLPHSLVTASSASVKQQATIIHGGESSHCGIQATLKH
ncbi:mCG145950, partial [Mus musculus]